ncbi:MAG: phosphate starvation-inducible PhoH-like protein [Flavobacteriales bacterium]
MKEKLIQINEVNLIDLFGVNEEKLILLKSYFPKLKIVARGNELKLYGDDDQLERFESKMQLIISYLIKAGRLDKAHIEALMLDDGIELLKASQKDDVLLFGNKGLKISARTPNQQKIVDAVAQNDMVFAVGPAGTGKTYTAVALAIKALKNKEVKRIILTRPAVEAGENLGFLPGDLKEKLDPYMQPLYDALYDMLPVEKLMEYIEHRVIEVAPLAFMRGRTLDKAFVILDEAQNATESQMKMFLTRMGKTAKFIVTGDTTQIDLPKHQKSGLIKACQVLDQVKGISIIKLTGKDIIRHPLVEKVINAFENEKI